MTPLGLLIGSLVVSLILVIILIVNFLLIASGHGRGINVVIHVVSGVSASIGLLFSAAVFVWCLVDKYAK